MWVIPMAYFMYQHADAYLAVAWGVAALVGGVLAP